MAVSTKSVIAVVDYGRGNLRSVAKALEAVGAKVRVTASAAGIARAQAVVVPGVGAFGDATAALRRLGLDKAIKNFAASGKPLLGVCLGLQIFCETGTEFGRHKGFGFFKGEVRSFTGRIKVPHMGWNQVRHHKDCPLFKGLPQNAAYYFVHSFHAAATLKDQQAGITQYGSIRFASALWQDNVYATQFHPEKSQRQGLALYRNFWRMAQQKQSR